MVGSWSARTLAVSELRNLGQIVEVEHQSASVQLPPKRGLVCYLINTIIMIGTSMSHPFRTLLLFGYSKTMRKSTIVRIPAFRTSQ